jgi:membrane carboxypeptidase/penicillin-binding protein PbpC
MTSQCIPFVALLEAVGSSTMANELRHEKMRVPDPTRLNAFTEKLKINIKPRLGRDSQL